MSNKNITKSVKCSFCGKPQEMVKRIVAGPNAYICDECIAICNNIIEDENYDEETGYEDLIDFFTRRQIIGGNRQ